MLRDPFIIDDPRLLAQLTALARYYAIGPHQLIERVLLDWIAKEIMDCPNIVLAVPELEECWP